MFQIRAKLIYNKRVKGNYWHCAFKARDIARIALPGQFINIKINPGCQPLLRRPLSIHRVDAANIEILYEVVGPSTELLAKKKSGEWIDVIGPLGNGFNLRPNTHHPAPILVAGGMGVAPLVFLAEKLTKRKILVLIGAKNKSGILCAKEFKDLGCDVKIATEDGSQGFKGYVTELLNHILSTLDHQQSTIYACGPKLMLKAVSQVSIRHKIPGQISLEEHMACGLGACLGCVVRTKDGFKRACKEGPVFKADEIIW